MNLAGPVCGFYPTHTIKINNILLPEKIMKKRIPEMKNSSVIKTKKETTSKGRRNNKKNIKSKKHFYLFGILWR